MAAQESLSSTTFLMPNLEAALATIPNHGLNVHHEEVCAESRAWIKNFEEAVCGPHMRAFLEHCNFELLATLCYPYASKDGLRATMDSVCVSQLIISHVTQHSQAFSSTPFSCMTSLQTRRVGKTHINLLLSCNRLSLILALTMGPGFAS